MPDDGGFAHAQLTGHAAGMVAGMRAQVGEYLPQRYVNQYDKHHNNLFLFVLDNHQGWVEALPLILADYLPQAYT
jgi:hypothetical protein